MNILFMFPSINPIKGGIERVTSLLINYFKSCGHNAYCIGMREEYRDFEPEMYYLPDQQIEDSELNKKHLAHFVAEKEIDIVVCQTGGPGPCCDLLYSLPQTVGKIVCLHLDILDSVRHIGAKKSLVFEKYHLSSLGNFLEFKPINRIVQRLYRIKRKQRFIDLCNYPDRVVLLSDTFKDDFYFMSGKSKNENVISMHNPLPEDFYRYSIKKPCEKSKTLLYVGRLNTSQKKVDYLLQIWSKLYKKHPDWTLKIVGGGEEEMFLKEKARVLNLSNCSFEGFKDPIEYYRDASILCMTSSYEGFGMVLIEAMCFGTIPIAFNSYSSVSDIIDDNHTGFLVKAFDIDEYVSKIDYLICNESIRSTLYDNCIMKSKQFAINRIGDKWLKLFKEIKESK